MQRLSRPRQLAFLEDFALGLADGLSPLQTCIGLAENAKQQGLRAEYQLVQQIIAQLNAGQPLGPALQGSFAQDLVMLMAVGEHSGVLDQLLQRQQQFEQQRYAALQAFWKPLLYPLAMLALALLACVFIGQQVMPKLAAALPPEQWPQLSGLLLQLSHGPAVPLLLLAVLLVLLACWGPALVIDLSRWYWRALAQRGCFVIRRYFDAVLLLQTVTVLLKAGMNLDRAILAMQAYSNSSMDWHLGVIRQRLAQGERQLAVLFDTGLLSARMLFRLSNGSRQASEQGTLLRVAEYATQDAVRALGRLRVLLLGFCYGMIFMVLVVVLGGMGAMLMTVSQQHI
ncbi:type II secretion system F family protein [Pseudidiomarina sp. PP-1MA]|uniref:Type II secretion system F family protein n=1 Tax=Pseudidiomarina sp. PP-1MA TaxID=3237706 RepID=A0AB39XB49_9GAMM